ncbi:MAG: hypothetical protein NC453_14900 [Muribaculum sp.]|nr:hypothetical protein [Muribaculum sp.]
MNATTKLLIWADSIILAFYLGRCYAKKTKRRNRKSSQKIKNEIGKTSKPLQIEVSVENSVNNR